ncbi:MAG: DUF362 domain-containing protein [Candidatus Thermoplasmatota archaeon]|nr:DUF362 domain-containing protein [Candidatus Thermoplasmatota archaeon]
MKGGKAPRVHIVRASMKGSEEALERTLEALNWKERVRTNSKVVIKPNGCHVRYLPGLVTTPKLLGELVALIRTRASEVVVVESDLQRFTADQVFDGLGYREVVERAGGRCSNLTTEKQVKSTIPEGQFWKERTMPESLVDNDLFVSMPVMKTHKLWLVTLGIKNQFGNVPEADRVRYQKYLPQVVGDFNAFCPAGLIITDGIIGMEADGPIAGIPKRMDLVVGGDNLVATDSVLCNIMGFDPLESGLIKNCYERGMGPVELSKIKITGASLDKVRRPYKGPSKDFVSRMERRVRRHPALANFVYRSWFFNIAKRTAWGIRGLYGYKSRYHEDVERTGLWKGYDWEELMQVYTPIA